MLSHFPRLEIGRVATGISIKKVPWVAWLGLLWLSQVCVAAASGSYSERHEREDQQLTKGLIKSRIRQL